MPPRSPLPRCDGLDASWVRTPDRDRARPAPWASMGEFLVERLPQDAPVDEMLDRGAFVDGAGRPWSASDAYRPNAFVWFHRPLAPEPEVPFPLEILHADDRIVVVDKPHFLATTPRGIHIRQSVVVKLRNRLGLPELAPAHRLDRMTAGVLVLTTLPRWRAAYAGVFATRLAEKTYEAIARHDATMTFPRRLVGRIEKRRDRLQAELVPGEPNAETHVDVAEVRAGHARYRLTPTTGKTHQLRLQMCALGLPIVGDPLYPSVREVAPGDFDDPLHLVARRLEFRDPVDGERRVFESAVRLEWPA